MRRTASVVAVLIACTALAAPSRTKDAFGQAQAQEPPERDRPAEFDNPRFAFHPSDDGYLRLDMRTGEVATCRPRAVGWACVLAPDERVALDGEIARLKRENGKLKNALMERGLALPDDVAAAPPEPALAPPPVPPAASPLTAAPPAPPAPPPAEVPGAPAAEPPVASAPQPRAADPAGAPREASDTNRLVNAMEKVWRRLVETMANIQRDLQKKI